MGKVVEYGDWGGGAEVGVGEGGLEDGGDGGLGGGRGG